MRLLNETDDFELLGGGVSHERSSPAAIMLFFKQPQPERLFGGDPFEGSCLVAKQLDLVGGGGAGRVANQAALAGFKEFLGPGVLEALGDALLAAQSFEDDADLMYPSGQAYDYPYLQRAYCLV